MVTPAVRCRRTDGHDPDTTDVLALVLIIVPSAMSWRNDGHRIGYHAPKQESSLGCGVTNSVVHHCNLARPGQHYLVGLVGGRLASAGSQYFGRFQPSRMDHWIHRRSQDEHGHGGHTGSQWQPQHIPVDLDAVVHG